MDRKTITLCQVFTLTAALFLNACQNSEREKTTGAAEIVIDIDGNKYHTITIGRQIWMADNLKVERFRNGDLIQNLKNGTEWENTTDPAYCYFRNEKKRNKSYGKLYNWHAVNDSRGLCPKGWHIPSDDEWQLLSDFLGGNEVAGDKMKAIGFKYWAEPNPGATNQSGFTALPCGGRDEYGEFITDKYGGHWWSTTADGSVDIWIRSIYFGYGSILRDSYHKNSGFSVRCVKN